MYVNIQVKQNVETYMKLTAKVSGDECKNNIYSLRGKNRNID